MSLGVAVIRGDGKLVEQSLRNAREIASEARSLLSRGQDPLDIRNADKIRAHKHVQEKNRTRRKSAPHLRA